MGKRLASSFRRIWPGLKVLLGLGIVALAVWVLSSHRDELAGLTSVLKNLRWWWIPPAVVSEMASFICFAGLQHEFLHSGGLTAPGGHSSR